MRPMGRVLAFLTVALLAWGAIAVMRPLPERKAGTVLSGRRVPSWVTRVDTLGSGETITELLDRLGLTGKEAQDALDAATAGLDPRRLRAGMRITLGAESADSVPSEIVLHLAVDRLLRLRRSDSGWVGAEESLPWTTDTLVVGGTLGANLYDAFDRGAVNLPRDVRAELAWDVADVFEYRLDMSRDLQEGDAFLVLIERQQTTTGVVRVGNVLAVDYTTGGKRLRVIRLPGSEGRARYFDEDGRSMQAMFLRAPLEFRRISSVFGMRRHPILGVVRRHRGTDYAASSGTPVRSIGDGVVVTAGRMSGFGNVIDVRHPNGFVTRYGHLRGFATGIRRGVRVGIGQTIGFVGMTGLATAPHLHFEVLVRGVQQNPRTALSSTAGAPLEASERSAFDRARTIALARLDQHANGASSPSDTVRDHD
ncbi:MAG: M23 family metallopeptidase [Gemmatimonadaceae bacterium]|nr:M23 family metallopeptidase [Gemmatimonadaceae bacterium]